MRISSKRGRDVYENRVIGYCNIQYSTILKLLAYSSPSIMHTLQLMAINLPTCSPFHEDTEDALIHQGDIIESLLSLLRETRNGGFLQIAYLYPERWLQVISEHLVKVCWLIDNIWTVCLPETGVPLANKRGNCLKKVPDEHFSHLCECKLRSPRRT